MERRLRGPRERLDEVGAHALSDPELVALVLGTGARGETAELVGTRLLSSVGGLYGLERAGVGSLSEVRGVGRGKAARLVAAVELGKRAVRVPLPRGRALGSSRRVDDALRPRLACETREHFLAIPLDARNRPLGEQVVAIGGLTACAVAPADVFRGLVREAACGVVFVHNHPSGDATPSPEDLAVTERLYRAGELLGLRVLDHVIVARDGYFSFLDAGLLGPGRPA